MAFNWQTFRTRTLTAAVFVVVMLFGLLWNRWSFFILFSIIHFGCWWEYFRLMEKIHGTTYHRYIQLGFMLVGFAIMLKLCGSVYEISSYSLKNNFSFPVSVAGSILLLSGIFQTKQINLKTFWAGALGLLYISLSCGLMMNLRRDFFITERDISDHHPAWHWIIVPCSIIFSIWINDTMAYIVGSLIGKTPLSKVSPKKTVEGTLGGIILAIVVAGIIAWLCHFDIMPMIIIAAIASIAGTFGDLLESKLKRMAGVKDSGHIMPGHGGFLDRFDSMLLAIPTVWLYVYFFLK